MPLSYCGACGQKFERHPFSLWDVMSEFLEVITHLDSRLWRTMGLLLATPGYLSQQFLAGRRTSYLAPFRLYFGISVAFFLVASLAGPHGAPGRQIEPRAVAEARCVESVSHLPGPEWLSRPFLNACEETIADHSRQLNRDSNRNLGRARFVFLPLMAALMQLLYCRPRRPYITHLMLLIHDQTCVFFLLSIDLLALRWLGASVLLKWLNVLLACYLISYFIGRCCACTAKVGCQPCENSARWHWYMLPSPRALSS